MRHVLHLGMLEISTMGSLSVQCFAGQLSQCEEKATFDCSRKCRGKLRFQGLDEIVSSMPLVGQSPLAYNFIRNPYSEIETSCLLYLIFLAQVELKKLTVRRAMLYVPRLPQEATPMSIS